MSLDVSHGVKIRTLSTAWEILLLGMAEKFGGLGPSFSKHLGGRGMVVVAHRVVMDILRIQLGLTRSPTFLISGTIPRAHLLLMSLNVAKCNLR